MNLDKQIFQALELNNALFVIRTRFILSRNIFILIKCFPAYRFLTKRPKALLPPFDLCLTVIWYEIELWQIVKSTKVLCVIRYYLIPILKNIIPFSLPVFINLWERKYKKAICRTCFLDWPYFDKWNIYSSQEFKSNGRAQRKIRYHRSGATTF